MKKTIIVLVTIVIVAALSGIVWWQLDNKQEEYTGPVEDVTVRLKWLHQSQFAGMYWADQAGYYKDAGINIKLLPFDYSHFPIEEVVAGNADFGVTGADEILVARDEGKPIKALAVIYQENPVVAYALKSSNIKEPKDFIGKRVGIESNINVEFNIRGMLENQGIHYNKDIIAVPIKYDHTPLINGEVDVATGYITNEPIQAEEAGFPVNIISPSKYGINLYADVLFATEDMVENNPELVQRFVSATLKGWNEALKDIDQAVNYTLLYKDPNNKALNFEHQKKLLENSVPLIKPTRGTKIGDMNFQRWSQMYNLLSRYEIIKQETDISSAYTLEFIR